jgi:hypothetical protein
MDAADSPHIAIDTSVGAIVLNQRHRQVLRSQIAALGEQLGQAAIEGLLDVRSPTGCERHAYEHDAIAAIDLEVLPIEAKRLGPVLRISSFAKRRPRRPPRKLSE